MARHLARQVATKEKFSNGQELLGKLKAEWEKIPLCFLEKLVVSMPQRIDAIIKASGGATSLKIPFPAFLSSKSISMHSTLM